MIKLMIYYLKAVMSKVKVGVIYEEYWDTDNDDFGREFKSQLSDVIT